MQAVFSSERIDFQPVSEALIPEYLVMLNDIEGVQRFITREPRLYDEASERDWVRGKLAAGVPIFSMIERATGRFIGNIEFMDRTDAAAELGIAITAARQEKRFGREAIRRMLEYGFETLGLREITLNVFEENARARHVYERCGFIAVGPGSAPGDIRMKVTR